MKTIYVDNNATTCIAPEVYEAMQPFLKADYFNPSSMYEPAIAISDAVSASRKTIAEALNAGTSRQILFTSCATESIS